jgi:hypothetical protein
MAEATGKAAAMGRKEVFLDRYQQVDHIWQGKSFIQYRDYRNLLADLPVSSVAVPNREYGRRLTGNLDYVYGEMLYSLTGYEGYLRDKAFPIKECFIRPIIRPNTFILEFGVAYQTKEGEEKTWAAEVIRTGETKYIYFLNYYRPM